MNAVRNVVLLGITAFMTIVLVGCDGQGGEIPLAEARRLPGFGEPAHKAARKGTKAGGPANAAELVKSPGPAGLGVRRHRTFSAPLRRQRGFVRPGASFSSVPPTGDFFGAINHARSKGESAAPRAKVSFKELK